MCAVAAPQDKTVTLPVTIFEGMVDSALTKMVRPPTKKMLGTMLRKSAPISTVPEAVVPSLSEERGLPAELPAKEKDKVVERTEGGGLKPTSEKQSAHVTAIKLQDPAHVKAFLRLHERAPGRGLGASKLILSQSKERRGKVGTKVAMGAGPLHISLRVPQGKAARKQLSSVTVKMNVVTMDENATVTMGATTYPEKMQQKLRAEIFESYLEMGRARMKICPELFETVRARLSSKVLCGKYAKEAEPLPPPPPPSRKGGGGKRGGGARGGGRRRRSRRRSAASRRRRHCTTWRRSARRAAGGAATRGGSWWSGTTRATSPRGRRGGARGVGSRGRRCCSGCRCRRCGARWRSASGRLRRRSPRRRRPRRSPRRRRAAPTPHMPGMPAAARVGDVGGGDM